VPERSTPTRIAARVAGRRSAPPLVAAPPERQHTARNSTTPHADQSEPQALDVGGHATLLVACGDDVPAGHLRSAALRLGSADRGHRAPALHSETRALAHVWPQATRSPRHPRCWPASRSSQPEDCLYRSEAKPIALSRAKRSPPLGNGSLCFKPDLLCLSLTNPVVVRGSPRTVEEHASKAR